MQKSTRKKKVNKKELKKVKETLEMLELASSPLQQQIIESMYEENIQRDKKRNQPYIV